MPKSVPQKGSLKLARMSLPEALAASLQERILDGEFKEGDPLVQETIAAEYEVSRMPVREALRQLEATGLVILKTHKGAVVTSIPVEQVAELFELRALLECEIFERAIPLMSDEHGRAAAATLEQLERAYEARDVSNWGRLNWEFHKSLYVPANRPQTLNIVQGINVQTDRYIRLQLLLTDAVQDAEDEHRELLRLARTGAATEGRAFLAGHIRTAGRNLCEALREKRRAEAA